MEYDYRNEFKKYYLWCDCGCYEYQKKNFFRFNSRPKYHIPKIYKIIGKKIPYSVANSINLPKYPIVDKPFKIIDGNNIYYGFDKYLIEQGLYRGKEQFKFFHKIGKPAITVGNNYKEWWINDRKILVEYNNLYYTGLN